MAADNVTHIRPAQIDGDATVDISAAVDNALLVLGREAAAGPLTVIVNDPQRHTNTPAVLSALAQRVGPRRTRLLIACGSHKPPCDTKAFEQSLCEDRRYRQIAWHDCNNPQLASIGATTETGGWRGHPWLLEDEAVLAIGSVEPHYFAGLTGAHKTATIGVAAYADIEANHAWAVCASSRPCSLDGNPVHGGIANMVRKLERRRSVAAVNLVQIGRQVFFATGGGLLQTLTAAAPHAEKAFVRRIDRPADTVVAEVAGPLGQSFYQADKGIKNNEWAVRNGGCLVLVAPCPDGIGQDQFTDLLRDAATYDQAAAVLHKRGYHLGDHKAVRLRYLTDPAHRGVRVFVVSDGLSDDDARLLGLSKAKDAAAALAAAGIDPRRQSVYHVHDAGNVCLIADAGDNEC